MALHDSRKHGSKMAVPRVIPAQAGIQWRWWDKPTPDGIVRDECKKPAGRFAHGLLGTTKQCQTVVEGRLSAPSSCRESCRHPVG
jgi:hypothetical protein